MSKLSQKNCDKVREISSVDEGDYGRRIYGKVSFEPRVDKRSPRVMGDGNGDEEDDELV